MSHLYVNCYLLFGCLGEQTVAIDMIQSTHCPVGTQLEEV